jgi:hypothetical protein
MLFISNAFWILARDSERESIVSEVLLGQEALNKQHIEKLSQLFKMSAALFFERRLSHFLQTGEQQPQIPHLGRSPNAGAIMDYHECDEVLSFCGPAFHRLCAAVFRRAVS